jgi:ornithine carbamoyltransferase
MTVRHLLDVDDLTTHELVRVLDLAAAPDRPQLLAGRSVALYFEKPSLRTRHSSEVATVQLGGHPLTFRADEVGTGSRELLPDIAAVLSGYHALLGARVFSHADLEDLAATAAVPVVNLLSEQSHPCQAVADLLTMRTELGGLDGRTVAWIGDFNNVARSLSEASVMSGMSVRLACPPGYGPTDADLDHLVSLGATAAPFVTGRPAEAADGADAVHTDVWASMGHEEEALQRHQAFEGFTVDDEVMEAATPGAVFMHCLPVHRGEEAAASVVDGPRSRVFQQAHARLDAFRGVLRFLLGEVLP